MTTVKFCKKCKTLLYLGEDRERKNLIDVCRNCDYEELAESNVVYYKKISRGGDPSVVNPEQVLPVTKAVPCPECIARENTFYQEARLSEEDDLWLYFVCSNPECGALWHDKEVSVQKCKECGHREATCFHARLPKEGSSRVSFLCNNPNCGARWRPVKKVSEQCKECGHGEVTSFQARLPKEDNWKESSVCNNPKCGAQWSPEEGQGSGGIGEKSIPVVADPQLHSTKSIPIVANPMSTCSTLLQNLALILKRKTFLLTAKGGSDDIGKLTFIH